MDWKKFVKAIRTETGLTTKDLAGIIGVSRRTVEDWEQGRRKPSKSAQKLLSKFHADTARKQCVHYHPGIGHHTIREEFGTRFVYSYRAPLGEYAPKDADPREWSLIRYPVALGPEFCEAFNPSTCEWVSPDIPD